VTFLSFDLLSCVHDCNSLDREEFMKMAKFQRGMGRIRVALLLTAASVATQTAVQAAEIPANLKVAVVQFLGGAAAPHDELAVNAAKLLFEQINANGGIGGVPIDLTVVDERGEISEKVTEFRRLVQEDKVKVAGELWVKFLATGFENLGGDTPRGPVYARKDHQAVHDSVWVMTTGKKNPKYSFPALEKPRVVPTVNITPLIGVKSFDQINSWPENK